MLILSDDLGHGPLGCYGQHFTAGRAYDQGFDLWVGQYDQVHAHFSYPWYLWKNGERILLPENEGGIRVPMIARWPGKIAPGTTSGLPTCFYDLMPTLERLKGFAAQAHGEPRPMQSIPASTWKDFVRSIRRWARISSNRRSRPWPP